MYQRVLIFAAISCFILLGASLAGAQDSLNKGLQELSSKISEVIGEEGIKRIAVLRFENANHNYNQLAEQITEDISVYLTKNERGFEVYDRNNLDLVLDEHKLNLSGLMDESTTKQVGEFCGVDALVVGHFSVFGDFIKVVVKVLDTSTAKQIAAETSSIMLDDSSRSFIQALFSESATSDSLHEEQAPTGTFCFEHNKTGARTTFVKLISKSSGKEVDSMTVSPNDNVCSYDLEPGVYTIKVIDTYGNVVQNYQIKIKPGTEVKKKMKN